MVDLRKKEVNLKNKTQLQIQLTNLEIISQVLGVHLTRKLETLLLPE
jgi:hypothetical protein